MTNDCVDIFSKPRHALAEAAWGAPDGDARLACSIASNPAAAIVCSLRDLRYVMVNCRFLALTRSAEADWLMRSIYERNILEGAENPELVKRLLIEAETIPQTRVELVMPGGESRQLIVSGQPVTVAGQSCMLFTLTDIEAWQTAERHRDQIRSSFETVFATSPAGMMLVDAADNLVKIANEGLCSLLGYSASEIAGRSADDIDIWPSGIGSGFVRAKGGSLVECRVSRASVTITDQTYDLWAFQDVTRRRIDERSLTAAIEAAISESKWLSHAILDNLALKSAQPPRVGTSGQPPEVGTSGLHDLTAREREVLTLICHGMDSKTMARRLNVSGNTVRNHIARVYAKIGVNRRVAAAAWARTRGFDSETTCATLGVQD